MASTIAANRLRKELTKLKKDPPPGVIAEPKESDILTWFYAIQGPPDTVYEGGVYVGKLLFPKEYPMKPPSIMMLTPSGRFQVNMRLCMSMSDFHPQSWNPMWSVATILQGVVSFMASEELTTGGLKAPDSERKRLAGLSKAYNEKHFHHLFDGDMDSAFEEAEEARKAAEAAAAKAQSSNGGGGSGSIGRRGRGRITGPRRRTTKDNTKKDDNGNESDNDKDQEEEDEDQSEGVEEVTKQLSEAEIEKRRKKNAKKRAKQKAKKAAASSDNNENGAGADDA